MSARKTNPPLIIDSQYFNKILKAIGLKSIPSNRFVFRIKNKNKSCSIPWKERKARPSESRKSRNRRKNNEKYVYGGEGSVKNPASLAFISDYESKFTDDA